MNRMRFLTKYVLLLCLLLPGTKLLAQGWMVDLNFILGNPQNEFEDNVDALGFGGSIAGGYYFGTSPIMIGADFTYMIYGNETRQEPFSITIPDVMVDVETSNNIFQGHLLLRMQNNRGTVRPYIEGLLGFNYLFTQTKIQNQRDWTGEPIAESTNFDDTAFSYGAGGGIALKLGTIKGDKDMPKRTDILLNFGVRYMFGGEAEYLKEGSITRENGQVQFDVSRSRTDLITYEFGVVFGF